MTTAPVQMLTIKEASQVTGLSMYFIRQSAITGRISAIRTGTSKSKILVNLQSILDLLQESTLSVATNNEATSGIRRIAE